MTLLDVCLTMFLVLFAIALAVSFFFFLFCNEFNKDHLIAWNIKKTGQNFLIVVLCFVSLFFVLKPIGWLLSYDENKEWELSTKPYATEELASKVNYVDGYYKFNVYDHKTGLSVSRSMPSSVSSIYYKDIEDPYVEWYKDVSKMLIFESERTRIKLYLPESWRNN